VERALYIGAKIVPLRFDTSEVSKSLSYFLTTLPWIAVLSRPADRDIETAAQTIAGLFLKAAQEPAPTIPRADSTAKPNPSKRGRNMAIGGAVTLLGMLILIALLGKTWNNRLGNTHPSSAIIVSAPKTEVFRPDATPTSSLPKEPALVSADSSTATSTPAASAPQMPGERYPETRTRLLSPAELKDWNLDKLRYAINEIFARNGATFPDKKIQTWFGQFAWYKARTNLTFDQIESSLPEIEQQNVKTLADARQTKTTSGTAGASIWRGTIHELVSGGGSFDMPCEFTFDETLQEVSSVIQVDAHRGGSTRPYTRKGGSYYFNWPVPDKTGTITYFVFTPAADGQTASVRLELIIGRKRFATGSGTFSKLK
jgi:hypothetical protein